MDAIATDSDLEMGVRAARLSWLARERASGRFYRVATLSAALLLLLTMVMTAIYLRRDAEPGTLISPPLIALLLIANLLPAIGLMVLTARNIARRSAEARGVGTGQLHTRLVALFSVIAAVPTVVVAIFASLLLQSGLQFWFSNRARTMLENTGEIAQISYDREVGRVAAAALAMAGDVSKVIKLYTIHDPRFAGYLAYTQVYQRELSEAIVFRVGADGQILTDALVNPYERKLEQTITPAKVAELQRREAVAITSKDRIGALTRLPGLPGSYLYVARVLDPTLQAQLARGGAVLSDYHALLARSRDNQLKFNLALYLVALIIVGLAILAALRLADRMVKPVGELVDAAGRIEEGDFAVRVPVHGPQDEIAVLGAAFNRMTGRLEEQTGALMAANSQLDTRRAFIEAVLSSVTAGIVTLDQFGKIVLTNRSAVALLQPGDDGLEGRELRNVSPELAEFVGGDAREATVFVGVGSTQRALAIKRVRYGTSTVLTFDDITEQLSDQRRAAWSDIARRIAHEIKNPLTPISLAAERLQRRYGGQIATDRETFDRLTGTIVRQVGDLRRMVDEFSNFARMPKPVFREENVHEIARNALFLHEVAHPDVTFQIEPATGDLPLVCDRRQLGQALTNVVKNGVEAIEARRARGVSSPDGDRIRLQLCRKDEQLVIDVTDTGIGLPEDRERLTEPYMTTRVRGTGLGLAIVKKIVEEHLGEIAFLDRPGGGTHVRIAFDADRLATLEMPEAPAAEDSGGMASRRADDLDDHEEPA